MNTAPVIHVYVLGSFEQPGLMNVLAELGLEGKPLSVPVDVLEPALILVGPGQEVPAGYHDIAFTPPVGASPSVLRELLRVAMENVVLKRQVGQLDAQAARRHRQFRELNRIGIALSAEKDIDRLQAFILTSMRQLTHADGASLWLKTEDENGAKLFLASSQNHSIDKSTYSAFTVPVDLCGVRGAFLRRALEDIRAALGERRIAVCRELTKLHEEIFRGTLSEAIEHFAEPRGEFTLVVQGAQEPAAEATDDDLRAELRRLRTLGASARDAAADVARRTGVPRRRVYALSLEIEGPIVDPSPDAR